MKQKTRSADQRKQRVWSHCPHFKRPEDDTSWQKLHLNQPTPQKRWKSRRADPSYTFRLSTESTEVSDTLICKSLGGYESVFFSKQLAITSIYSGSRTQADSPSLSQQKSHSFYPPQRKWNLQNSNFQAHTIPRPIIYFIINLKNNIKSTIYF